MSTDLDPRECSECGHDIFDMHDSAGCHLDGCTCPVTWSRKDKRAYAKREGIRPNLD